MFGENLRKIMKEKKITSRKLAAEIGVTETYISYLLSGKKTPSLKTVDSLVRFLGVTPTDLITKKEPQPTEGMEALIKKYEKTLLALEKMRPDLVADIMSRIEAAASLLPRKDAPESQGGASYSQTTKPG